MIFRYLDEDNEIALTSKGLNYKGINDEPYLRLMQLYVYNLLYYYLII